MAFGFASKPTRKWAYGVRERVPGTKDSFPGIDAAFEQLRRAHDYQNKLVEVELARRKRIEEIVEASHPDLPRLRAEAEAASGEVAALRSDLSGANSRERKLNADESLSGRIKTARREAGVRWKAYSDLRKARFADAGVKKDLRANDEEFADRRTNARNEAVASGLYWGTAASVATRVKQSGPPPKFRRWTGEGVLSVQIQRKPDRSTPREPVLNPDGTPRLHPRNRKPMYRHLGAKTFGAAEAFAGASTSVRIERTTRGEAWGAQPPHARGPAPENPDDPHPHYVTVSLRIASDIDGNPVWARLPAHYSRPIPPDAEIKWVHLSCRKVGTRRRWEVLFDLARDRWERGNGRQLAETGTVAVALGWREIDGAVRVASWVGSDGASGEVTIPADRVSRWRYCDRLQGIRDTLFEESKARLAAWVAARKEPLPEGFASRVSTVSQWRSPSRLAALAVWWRSNRFPGDEEIFRLTEGELVRGVGGARDHYTGGRKQDKHLYDWAEAQRQNCINWRKNFYRETALALAKRYKTAVVEDIDWAEIGEALPPEEAEEDVDRRNRGVAACASLRDALTNLMDRVAVDPAGVVVDCHACGTRCPAPGSGRWVFCPRCGDRKDRLDNAARNLLRRGTASPGEPARGPQPPASPKVPAKGRKKAASA